KECLSVWYNRRGGVRVSTPGFEDPHFSNKEDGRIFISQDKYVANILKKFNFTTVKITSTPMKPNNALIKDAESEDTSHLHDVKRIFIYLKGQPKLGLWYPKDSQFDLEAFSDSDYVGASLDRKFTKGGCQFLGKRLISWQCKKQTIVASSTTEAEYVAAANYCGQVLWIQNQMLYYGFNFMNTKIYIDNESTIYIVKNPVFHSKTKHIEIRHHFIRGSYEKKLIQATAKSKTVNDVKQIHAKVDGKIMVISESSVRSDLYFNDEDDITFYIAGDAVNTASVIPDVSVAGPYTSTAGDIFKDEMTTIPDTLMAIRSTRPRTTSVVIHNVEEEPRRATPLPTVQSQDKEQAQFEREQRIAKEKVTEQEAKDAALIKQMEDVQARRDADELLVERLQQEEREQFTVNEKARMLVDLIAK
nr:putative ribonuclease H-like domain-containing protein [Tanacetum cinerariifolium]